MSCTTSSRSTSPSHCSKPAQTWSGHGLLIRAEVCQESGSQLPQDQIVDYALTADDDTLTFNFAPSEDGNTHYLVCGISLSLNKKSDGYKTYGEDLSAKKNVILADITDIIGDYTMEQYNADKSAVHDKILKTLQKKFGADYIVDVNIVSSLTQ